MALSDAIQAHVKKESNLCAVGLLIEKLSEGDRKTLLDAIANGVSTHALVLALRQEGYRTSDNNFNTHRQGNCKCPTK